MKGEIYLAFTDLAGWNDRVKICRYVRIWSKVEMIKIQNILFDLDGTLTDPKEGITKSVQYALKRMGIVVEDTNQLIPFIGPPLAKSFMEQYSFSESQAQQAVKYYREYFSDRGIFENEIYPGVKPLLKTLKTQDRTVILATSKPTYFAQKILDHFDISHYFDFVCGSNMDGTRSDKTEIIGYILDQMKLDKKNTVMIGDRMHDIIGAHHNQIDAFAVLYGYGSEKELMDSNPTKTVKTVEELYSELVCEANLCRLLWEKDVFFYKGNGGGIAGC